MRHGRNGRYNPACVVGMSFFTHVRSFFAKPRVRAVYHTMVRRVRRATRSVFDDSNLFYSVNIPRQRISLYARRVCLK